MWRCREYDESYEVDDRWSVDLQWCSAGLTKGDQEYEVLESSRITPTFKVKRLSLSNHQTMRVASMFL